MRARDEDGSSTYYPNNFVKQNQHKSVKWKSYQRVAVSRCFSVCSQLTLNIRFIMFRTGNEGVAFKSCPENEWSLIR